MSTRDHPDWWRPMGGQNSQDSILERRSLVWNDNAVEAPDAPPANYTETIYKGKFYPRGCRGMLEQLEIYCIRTGAGTLTLRYSPHPCLGPINTVTITPGATWAWVAADIEEMWDYDSLFIWVYECDADVSWAYDTEQPFDGHWSTDTGATWEDMAIRPFIRAVYTGETPGDVPISGIINNIPIPSVSSLMELSAAEVPINTTITLYTIEGVGHCDLIMAWVRIDPSSHLTRIWIDCDDVRAFNIGFLNLNDRSIPTNSPGIALPVYAVDGYCLMLITHKFEFRRYLRVLTRNNFAAVFVSCEVYPTLLR